MMWRTSTMASSTVGRSSPRAPTSSPIAFRGTASVANWETNLHAAMVHPDATDPNLRVHEGFFAAFNKLYDGESGLRARLSQAAAREQAAKADLRHGSFARRRPGANRDGGARHGSIRGLLHVRLAARRQRVFRPVGETAELPGHGLRRHRPAGPSAGSVPVPLSPFRRRCAICPTVPEGSPYRYEPGPLVRLGQLVIGIIQFFGSWQILGIQDHSVAMYAAKLARIAEARTSVPPALGRRARRAPTSTASRLRQFPAIRSKAPSAEARFDVSPCERPQRETPDDRPPATATFSPKAASPRTLTNPVKRRARRR